MVPFVDLVRSRNTAEPRGGIACKFWMSDALCLTNVERQMKNR